MKKGIYLTLIALVVVIAAVFAISKFYNHKTIAQENPATIKTAAGPTPRLVDFINQSSAEITAPSGRQNPAESKPTKAPAGENANPLAVLTVPNPPPILDPICTNAEISSFQCYDDYYTNLVNTRGIPAAFADIKIRETQNPYILSQCHPLSHSIGHAAAGLYPDILDAFAQGDSFCWSGYYHGILEEIIDTKGKAKTLAELNTICSKIPGKETYSFDYYNCVHGLGHGLMGAAGQELFDALKMCDILTGGWEKNSCYSGVFMENVIIENKGGTTKYLKPSDPLYPCDAVEDGYKQVCYLMQSSYMLTVSGNNFSTVFDLCASVEKQYQATCYQSLGRDASGQSSSNVEKTVATCNLGKNFEQKSNCVIGAVKDFISYFHSDVQARELCKALPAELSEICISTTESYYASF